MPKTFRTEETESGCLSKSATAIYHLTASCFIKFRTGFYYNFARRQPQRLSPSESANMRH
ncbi:hypothetical protein B5M10_22640 [Pluralibacter gergoviae]|nr:hypothetical protein A8H26_19290 [Pluralibacter gergoviae]OUQ93602.1 hypothetical protein B5M10_22640 [Pluralibacter gergoviae]PHH48902.1 hypothetical protein CRX51_15185 [Pluralibacter gergoviae]